jgi:hypothetical protein
VCLFEALPQLSYSYLVLPPDSDEVHNKTCLQSSSSDASMKIGAGKNADSEREIILTIHPLLGWDTRLFMMN